MHLSRPIQCAILVWRRIGANGTLAPCRTTEKPRIDGLERWQPKRYPSHMSIETLIALIAGFASGIAATIGSQRTMKKIGWRTARAWLTTIGIVAIIVLAIVFVATQP